jgi:hypothetical protein
MPLNPFRPYRYQDSICLCLEHHCTNEAMATGRTATPAQALLTSRERTFARQSQTARPMKPMTTHVVLSPRDADEVLQELIQV